MRSNLPDFSSQCSHLTASNAAFTLSGFDNQERNLTFVKRAFHVLKLKFLTSSMKQAFYVLHKQNIVRAWQQESTFLQAFHSVPGCQTCMCKRGISLTTKGGRPMCWWWWALQHSVRKDRNDNQPLGSSYVNDTALFSRIIVQIYSGCLHICIASK